MLVPYMPQSGIYKRVTEYAAAGRWIDGDKVRFIGGLPAKIGGWKKITASGATITGVPRGSIAYQNSAQVLRVWAMGTNSGLFVYNGDQIKDITPGGYTPGRTDSALAAGYGLGPYGASTYGTSRAGLSSLTAQATFWTMDTFGDFLIACANTDGKIYYWDGATSTATLVHASAPISNQGIVVTDERHVVALGASADARKVQWSDRGDYTVWTPAAGNRAGSYSLVDTSRIVVGKKMRGGVAIWTENALHGMFWRGGDYVYGFERLGENCGAFGPGSAIVVDGIPYWMGRKAFYVYDGAVHQIPCDVLEYVFDDLNVDQRYKIQSGYNSLFNEIWWFYPSTSSQENDRYVIFNVEDKSWSVGSMQRTAWAPFGVFPFPLAADASANLYKHENGSDDDTTAMNAFIKAGPQEIGNGTNVMRIMGFVPDLTQTGSVNIYVTSRLYPNAAETTSAAQVVSSGTEVCYIRQTGRQAGYKVESLNKGDTWKLGRMRFDVEKAGPV